jgi:hypothetical protein
MATAIAVRRLRFDGCGLIRMEWVLRWVVLREGFLSAP